MARCWEFLKLFLHRVERLYRSLTLDTRNIGKRFTFSPGCRYNYYRQQALIPRQGTRVPALPGSNRVGHPDWTTRTYTLQTFRQTLRSTDRAQAPGSPPRIQRPERVQGHDECRRPPAASGEQAPAAGNCGEPSSRITVRRLRKVDACVRSSRQAMDERKHQQHTKGKDAYDNATPVLHQPVRSAHDS